MAGNLGWLALPTPSLTNKVKYHRILNMIL